MQQALIEMHLPAFREGYQAGRSAYFQGRRILTDKELVALLIEIAQDGVFVENSDPIDAQWQIGNLLGQISGAVIPYYDDEEFEQEQRETHLLSELRRTLDTDAEAAAITSEVKKMWETQDRLAQRLDQDWYERVRHRDIHPSLKRCVDA
ncbi:hypothetical protein EPA93_42090 [Ktedonosporobacter rubrisoli]|uniref:Uncharacterized protein n=1 Tax=Ktedonosporobacter rubrisoli TaxID=2509675 RepID=A0A4P6K2W9_KTERU|nr:hypothetical protein [Ktedonosporobacter rubrisoli]QBD82223.1 hypothetical protein EPA93_42090 [Ktedonosporobacter rubrisoli]